MRIDAAKVEKMLADARGTSREKLDRILDRAEGFKGLAPEEVAALLVMDSKEHLERMFRIAGKIKEEI